MDDASHVYVIVNPHTGIEVSRQLTQEKAEQRLREINGKHPPGQHPHDELVIREVELPR